jgi:hypothetical protein
MKRPSLMGPLYGYLGHFRQPKHAHAGHNRAKPRTANLTFPPLPEDPGFGFGFGGTDFRQDEAAGTFGGRHDVRPRVSRFTNRLLNTQAQRDAARTTASRLSRKLAGELSDPRRTRVAARKASARAQARALTVQLERQRGRAMGLGRPVPADRLQPTAPFMPRPPSGPAKPSFQEKVQQIRRARRQERKSARKEGRTPVRKTRPKFVV